MAFQCAAAARQEDVDPLEGWIADWQAERDPDRKNDLVRCVAELLRGTLAEAAGRVLRRRGAWGRGVSVEDVVNETVSELPKILGSFVARREKDDHEDFRRYAAKSAIYIARDQVKDSRGEGWRLKRLADDDPSRLEQTPTTPSMYYMRDERTQVLWRAIARLEKRDQIIVLRRNEDVTYEAIGFQLKLATSSVRYRWERAMAYLRRIIDDAMGGDPLQE